MGTACDCSFKKTSCALLFKLSDPQGNIYAGKQYNDARLSESAKNRVSSLLKYDADHYVSYIDGFTRKVGDESFYVAVMDYCDGANLEDFIRDQGGKEELLPVYVRMFLDMARPCITLIFIKVTQLT